MVAKDFEKALMQPKSPESFFEYLGQHAWVDQSVPSIVEDHSRSERAVLDLNRQATIRSIVDSGQAAIIVDGLDEVRDATMRVTIRDYINSFRRENIDKKRRKSVDDFGNRLVVTSRVAGYNLCPLDGAVTHVLVRGMGTTAQQRFIENLMVAIHQGLLPEAEAKAKASALFHEVGDSKRRIRDFAANPLQAGALCAVYTDSGKLPETRGEVFELAISRFFTRWRDRLQAEANQEPFSEEELMRFWRMLPLKYIRKRLTVQF